MIDFPEFQAAFDGVLRDADLKLPSKAPSSIDNKSIITIFKKFLDSLKIISYIYCFCKIQFVEFESCGHGQQGFDGPQPQRAGESADFG